MFRGTLRLARRYSQLPPKDATVAKFVFPDATHVVRDVKETDQTITLHGHLHKKPRIQAKRSFAELRDTNGDIIQLYMSPEHTPAKLFEQLAASGAEDSVSVSGFVKQKQKKNDSDKAEYELVVSEFQTLNPAGTDAAQLDSLKHSNPMDIPPKFRYLQLRTPFFQNALRTRSKVAHLIRNTLVESHDFVEVETPLLFKSTPEGAREFLVPTRSPDRFYALPQSPQQYKQILMSSGFTRYFQLAKCFRDEDLRSDRQPEFTQVDLEFSFINDRQQVMDVIDDVIQRVWKSHASSKIYRLGHDGVLQPLSKEDKSVPFNKITYMEALTEYGIDKPDLRSSLSFVDISKHLTFQNAPKEFPVLEACVLKEVFTPGSKYKLPNDLTNDINYPKRKPYVKPIKTEEDAASWYSKFVEKGVLTKTGSFSDSELAAVLNLAPGDVLAFSTRAIKPYENPTPLGKFRQLAIEKYPNKWNRPIQMEDGSISTDYDIDKIAVGSWVVDFPLFSPVELTSSDAAGYPQYCSSSMEATHHPFTMANSEDYELLESDPLKVRGEHYDLVINGVEVGGGSRRIHDPSLQKFVFENILEINNYEQKFGHLLKALSMGCPPHAGIALGFDRLCAMLVGSTSIRDVVAFPKNQSGADPVVESPTDVSPDTLKEYFIKKL